MHRIIEQTGQAKRVRSRSSRAKPPSIVGGQAPSSLAWWPKGSEPWLRRRAGSCPAPSRGVLLARNERSILLDERPAYHAIAVFFTSLKGPSLLVGGVLGEANFVELR